MHIAETYSPADRIPSTKIITFEGEARSGKGTSVRAVRERLVAEGRKVVVIDQGQKFRTLAKLAVERGVELSEQAEVTTFLASPQTRPAMLKLLNKVAKMRPGAVNDLLYTQQISNGSSEIGKNAKAHPLVVGLLFDEVRQAATNGIDTVLIDGRAMEKYGRQMAEEHMGQFAMGFYFRCDAAIAARRIMGNFMDVDAMGVDQKLELLETITKVSNRNRDDTLREVDPMHEPANAYPLHTADFNVSDPVYVHQATLDALMSGMVSINTSYTRSVAEMTDPVVALATHALELHDRELERFTGNPQLWSGFQEFEDPRRSVLSGF